MKIKTQIINCLLFFIAVVVVGSAIRSADFILIRWLKIYIIEWAALAAILAIALEKFKILGDLKTQKWFWFLLAFFGLGCLRVAFDELKFEQIVIKKWVLFVYPVLWVSLGYWLKRHYSFFSNQLVLLLAVFSMVFSVLTHQSINLTLGLLGWAVTLYYFKTHKVLALWVGLAAVAYPLFSNVVQLGEPLQRLTLLQIIAMNFLGGYSLNLQRYFWPQQKHWRVVLIGLTLVLSVLFVQTLVKQKEFREKIYAKIRHGDDLALSESMDDRLNPFQFRDRKVWWNRAIAQWQTSKIWGVGFNVEVPDLLRIYHWPNGVIETVKNDGKFENAPDMKSRLDPQPVSGPHNSWLSVLARMGVLGFGGLLAFFIVTGYRVGQFIKSRKGHFLLAEFILLMIPLNSLLHATLQIGFESPRGCFLLWLFLGMVLGLPAKINVKNVA